jgi:hypothetical protein
MVADEIREAKEAEEQHRALELHETESLEKRLAALPKPEKSEVPLSLPTRRLEAEASKVEAPKDVVLAEANLRQRFHNHPVPATRLAEIDNAIAHHAPEDHSILNDPDKVYERAKVERQLTGDAGERRAWVNLVKRYGHKRIIEQPNLKTPGGDKRPDFVVKSETEPGKYSEIVDSKAWRLHARDASGELDYARLLEKPSASELISMSKLKKVVHDYSPSSDLASDGKVVLYVPEEIYRYAPQVRSEIESWSGTEIANGRTVEVRSLEVWQENQENPHLDSLTKDVNEARRPNVKY